LDCVGESSTAGAVMKTKDGVGGLGGFVAEAEEAEVRERLMWVDMDSEDVKRDWKDPECYVIPGERVVIVGLLAKWPQMLDGNGEGPMSGP
jgi:hypothetical protein